MSPRDVQVILFMTVAWPVAVYSWGQQSKSQAADRFHAAEMPRKGMLDGIFGPKDDSWKDDAMAANQKMLDRRRVALKGEKLNNVYRKQGRVRDDKTGKYDLNALTGTQKGAVIAKKSDKVSFTSFSSRNRESAAGDRAGIANNAQQQKQEKKGGWEWKW